MKPGSIVVGRSSLGRATVAARAHASASTLGEPDVLDRAQRHLQEARPELAERVRVAGAQEAVVALAARAGCAELARAQRVLDLARERRARADQSVTSGPSIRCSIGLISG